jgi:hypothetical protein
MIKLKKGNSKNTTSFNYQNKESQIFSNAGKISKAAISISQRKKISIVVLEGNTIYRKDYLGRRLNEIGTIVRSKRIIQAKTFSI